MLKRLNGKDLITVGVHSVLYFLIMLIVGFLGFIPIFIPLLAVLVPLLGGIPFMLFLSKTDKFGMITLMGIINGFLMFITGMGYWVIITGVLFGIASDLIVGTGKYSSINKNILGYGVFSIWVVGNFMPFFVNRDAWFVMLQENYGQEYSGTLSTYMPEWLLPVLILASLLFGLIGGVWGKILNKKHFKRAGIA